MNPRTKVIVSLILKYSINPVLQSSNVNIDMDIKSLRIIGYLDGIYQCVMYNTEPSHAICELQLDMHFMYMCTMFTMYRYIVHCSCTKFTMYTCVYIRCPHNTCTV